jgi:SAM-dependent methyltransferase
MGASGRDLVNRLPAREELLALSRDEVLDLIKELNRVRADINSEFVLSEGVKDKDHILNEWVAQSQIFIVDCIPYILEKLRDNHRRQDSATLLDVGSATGAGTALLKSLLSSQMLWCPVDVKGIDIFSHRVICAKNNFVDFEYIIGDIFNHKDRYDYVLCSHVLEHVPDAERFIRALVQLAKRSVFVYTPYNEVDRIPAHRNTITEETYKGFSVESTNIIKSSGWRWGKKTEDYCILTILNGEG